MNTLYYGDNLAILREYIKDESIDLIYLDPPFNSNRNYNVLFKDESGQEAEAQITAFEDSWHWNPVTEETYQELATKGNPKVSTLIGALHTAIGENQMMAYLVMMTVRLAELHRVLKSTGSLYLHCDATASHYLKIILDAVFGPNQFMNEIVWKRTGAHNSAKQYGPVHDILLYYAKSKYYTWNQQYQAQDEYIQKRYTFTDETGRKFYPVSLIAAGIRHGSSGQPWNGIDVSKKGNHWRYSLENLNRLNDAGDIYWPPKGGLPRLKMYEENAKGALMQDWWGDIPPINSQARERLGYPTQKPVALLERIIRVSSNPGDIVLDPFGGCGTTISAAQQLGREWIGIDITHLSIALQKYRLSDAFGLKEGKDYKVIGEPQDLQSAKQLSTEDRYQFQWWALSLIKARPLGNTGGKTGKKGSDKGIDGVISFIDEANGNVKRVLVQVKSGKVKSGDVRDLRGTVEREEASMGVFITLEPPTREMLAEAVSAGHYTSPGWRRDYPKLQIFSIEQLLAGAEIKMPPATTTFKTAKKETSFSGEDQQNLFD